ncbi:MAG: glutamate racemase [Gammaproteobacteria bacterium]|nr:glutamate racemase [Gammaproteobacteria bacterium]
MSAPGAIGMFDSGVGGFSVLRHALRRVDGRPLLYVADSRFAPYGDRPPDEIRARCFRIGRFLVAQGAAAIVVACNTATAIAIDALRAAFDIPVIGMEPALKPAAAATRSGQVAVLATHGTLRSERYARLLSDHGRRVGVTARICHHWVAAVEAGDLDSVRVRDRVHAAVAPLRARGVDTYVLGCTHFPLLQPVIRAAVGDAATLIDPGPAVVAQLRRRLAITGDRDVMSPLRLFTNGDVAHLRHQAATLLGLDVVADAFDGRSHDLA